MTGDPSLEGRTAALATVEKIARKPDADGPVFGEDQADAFTRIAVSGRVLDVLAPSAVAAQVLTDVLGIETENTAMWW